LVLGDSPRGPVGWGTPSRIGYQSNYNRSYWTTGDWADQHNPPRYKDFWNGFYQTQLDNPSWNFSVRIYQVHIYSTN
jgi:hypothetical protein